MIQGPIDILINDAGVQALLGTGTEGKYKVYPVRYPQKEGKETSIDKYITVYKTAGQPSFAKGCFSSLRQSAFNVNIYAENYEDLDAIFEAVVVALDTREGTFKGVDFIDISYSTD